MKEQIARLARLQKIDTGILEKRRFIEKVPLRIHEVDEPLKKSQEELDKIRQKTEALAKKKREKEKSLDEINEKIQKMKSRVSDIKTNKEYQAHLKEIESNESEISAVEDQILAAMEEMDAIARIQKEKEAAVKVETEKLNAFRKELDIEVSKHEDELSGLKKAREEIVSSLEPGLYNTYMRLLTSGGGVAVCRAKGEICLGCNMNMPPQLFVELRKTEDVIQCPQCRRILYFDEEAEAAGQ